MAGLFFTDSMTIDEFHCIECKKILKPPIILTSMGNMCLHHDSQNENTISSSEIEPARPRNIPLERMMEKITCTCKYKGSGCNEIVKLHEISEHEESCKFKTFTCLLAGCEWSGLESDYVSHLHKHTDYIDGGSDGMFQLDCSTEGTDDVHILRTISGLSLLHVKVLKEKLICAVYDIKNPYTESYKIWMTLERFGSLSKMHNEDPCQIINSLSQFIKFESVEGTEIKFLGFSPINNKNVTVCLEHVFNGEIVSSKLEDKSKYEVHLKLLEKMQVRLPCGNASLGCREQHTPESQHDNSSCYYKKWRCCVETICQFEGLFTNLVDHIESNHESIHCNETMVPLHLDSHKMAFIVYGNVFLLKYKNLLKAPSKNKRYTSHYNQPKCNYDYNTCRSKSIYHPHQDQGSKRLKTNQTERGYNITYPSRSDESSNDELNTAFHNYPMMKWQVLQLTDCSNLSGNFAVEITMNTTDGLKLFHFKDGFAKYSLNIYRWRLLLEKTFLDTLVPQCTEARVRILEIKK